MPRSRAIEFRGEWVSLSEWARTQAATNPVAIARNLSADLLSARVVAGWDPEEALEIGRSRRRGARAKRQTISDASSYEEDAAAARFIAEHPEGATLEEVGAALGVTRERARQLEQAAYKKIRELVLAVMQEHGIDDPREALAYVFAGLRGAGRHLQPIGGGDGGEAESDGGGGPAGDARVPSSAAE